MTKDDMVELVARALIDSEEGLLSGDTSRDNMIAARMLARAAIAAMHGSDSGVTEAMRANAIDFLNAFKADPFSTGADKVDRLFERLGLSSASAPDSGALREALVEARKYLSDSRLPLTQRRVDLLAKIDAALNLSSETGE